MKQFFLLLIFFIGTNVSFSQVVGNYNDLDVHAGILINNSLPQHSSSENGNVNYLFDRGWGLLDKERNGQYLRFGYTFKKKKGNMLPNFHLDFGIYNLKRSYFLVSKDTLGGTSTYGVANLVETHSLLIRVAPSLKMFSYTLNGLNFYSKIGAAFLIFPKPKKADVDFMPLKEVPFGAVFIECGVGFKNYFLQAGFNYGITKSASVVQSDFIEKHRSAYLGLSFHPGLQKRMINQEAKNSKRQSNRYR